MNYGSTFAIDESRGDVVLLQKLDHSKQATYNVSLIAQDMSEVPIPAMTTLSLVVEDINNHRPIISVDFMTESGKMEVDENQPVGTFVGHVSVSDDDDAHNGEIECFLDDGRDDGIEDRYQLDGLFGNGEYKNDGVDDGVYFSEGGVKYKNYALNDQYFKDDYKDPFALNDHQYSSYGSEVYDTKKENEERDVAILKLVPIYTGEYKLVSNRVFDREHRQEYKIILR